MKYNYFKFIIVALLAMNIFSCDLYMEPYDSKSDNIALISPEDLQTATYGTYSWLVSNTYSTMNTAFIGLTEYPGDNVASNVPQASVFTYALHYNHTPNMAPTTNFWKDSYKMIYSANRIIVNIDDGTSKELDQLKGENLFLRALGHFNLVRMFGRPYIQNNGDNPGIVIKDNIEYDLPERKTVKEVYDFMISDLLKAGELMTINKNACYASKEVAYALLSRIYLYKGENENAIVYANKVIQSSRYQLLTGENYKKYFTFVPENNSETIFAFRNIQPIASKGSVGGMFYNDPVTQSTGFGQVSPSLDYYNLLSQYPEDARHSFIVPQLNDEGEIILKNNVPLIYMVKYNFQEGQVNLSSPVYLRLAEMYLNRAEANAKLGNDQLAIDDVNLIRERAGLSGSALYAVDDLKGHSSILSVVLEERRLELAFEGHRAYDLFRNNLPLVRAYPGFHGTDRFNHRVEPNDPRIVFYIPESEMNVNPNLTQNP